MDWISLNNQRETSIIFDSVSKAKTNGYKMDNKTET